MRRVALAAVAASMTVASCTAPKPVPAPARVAAPPPVPRLTPQPPSEIDWRDRPLTPGNWVYTRDGAGSAASFGPAGAAVFLLRCDPMRHVLALVRPGGTGTTMTIQTSYASRVVPAVVEADGALVASLAARDPTLDQLAFSRGRFSIGGTGSAALNLPAWAEPARVIEDCR